MKNIKAFAFVFLIMTLAVVISGCGNTSKSPTTESFKSAIPNNILNYTVADIDRTSVVSDISLIRQQTNEKSDYAECMVVLSDECVTRTVKLGFTSNFYDKGGWQVDGCTLLSLESCTVDKKKVARIVIDDAIKKLESKQDVYPESDGSFAFSFKNAKNYTLSDDLDTTLEINTLSFINADVDGFIKLKTWVNDEPEVISKYNSSYELPMKYRGGYNIDSDLSTKWKINGNWRFEYNGRSGSLNGLMLNNNNTISTSYSYWTKKIFGDGYEEDRGELNLELKWNSTMSYSYNHNYWVLPYIVTDYSTHITSIHFGANTSTITPESWGWDSEMTR